MTKMTAMMARAIMTSSKVKPLACCTPMQTMMRLGALIGGQLGSAIPLICGRDYHPTRLPAEGGVLRIVKRSFALEFPRDIATFEGHHAIFRQQCGHGYIC